LKVIEIYEIFNTLISFIYIYIYIYIYNYYQTIENSALNILNFLIVRKPLILFILLNNEYNNKLI